MSEDQTISPLGRSARTGAAARYQASAEYRQSADRYAQHRAIARQIIHKRVARSWTQRDLAERMHTTDSAVSRWESGRRAVSSETLQRLADVFGEAIIIEPTPDSAIRRVPQTAPGR